MLKHNNRTSIATIAQRLKRAGRSAVPALWLLSDELRLKDPRAAIAALPRGAGFIFRHYGLPNREQLGRELRQHCRQHRILFSVAGDTRLAARLRADGVHLPQGLAHHAIAARQRNHNWLITVSAHDQSSMFRAATSGADAILLSPVFATASHPDAKPLGPLHFALLARLVKIPVIALGGITAANARRIQGASGIAAISALGV